MRPEQWNTFKTAAAGRAEKIPLALIIDSPWIPGYLGISHLDYYLDPDGWFTANRRVMEDFPDVIFFPSWWVEYGMAAEPSILGAKIRFWPDQTPSEVPCLADLEGLDRLRAYDVTTDGFAALTLHRVRMQKHRVRAAGYIMPVVTARGPLCTAGFVRGTTELMMDTVEQPEKVHELLDITTQLTIDWLHAQADALDGEVEGLFLLDDIVGFLGEADYMTFAHPCLKRICDAFPKEWVKVYHNDANITACLDHLPDTGFDVLNWGKQTDIVEVRARIGDRLCLMGNVNPLEVGVRGTAAEVKAEALRIIEANGNGPMILSFGGGVSPGAPRENIQAMVDAVREA